MGRIERLIARLPWQKGRQGTGYNKICLMQSRRWLCDAYLLYYPVGSEVPLHVDEVNFGRHFRLNIMLKRAKSGGEFICVNPIVRWWRVFYFRPDASQHMVTKIEEGYRVMLSIGWVQR
jgi:hypothetical protein